MVVRLKSSRASESVDERAFGLDWPTRRKIDLLLVI